MYLIQRLSLQYEGTDKPGFDSLFVCEYMGSAEYEFGPSLKRLRACRNLVLQPAEVTHKGVTQRIYVLGATDAWESNVRRMNEWLASDRPQSKERSYFPERVAQETEVYMVATAAWWDLDRDIMWTFEPEVAEKLWKGVVG